MNGKPTVSKVTDTGFLMFLCVTKKDTLRLLFYTSVGTFSILCKIFKMKIMQCKSVGCIITELWQAI